MVFSSTVFLFLFLPVTLVLYCLCPRRGRNALLLAASLLFYAWGAGKLFTVMLASIGINYVMGLLVDRARDTRWAKPVLALTVMANLAPLVYYKYALFLLQNVEPTLAMLHLPTPQLPDIVLPIGISFFTFQGMSYVIDVYRREGPAQRNPLIVALYVAFFPQLIAGPIVRYVDVAHQLQQRQVTVDGFAEGVERFVLGLAKKILLANSVASAADAIFAIPGSELTMAVAWLGVICYALQIYFDFSGYSDMAIGLGLMFGFRFVENFNYPYISRSVTEFWRRWHMSLSTWFRDYLYIPLGGNRHGAARTYFNLLTVFLLCGLWHGASWNFIIWGLLHGAFLIVERRFNWLTHMPGPLAHLYALLAVLVGWVFFRATDLTHAASLLAAMAGMASGDGMRYHLGLYLDQGLAVAFVTGAVCATPIRPWLIEHCRGWRERAQTHAGLAALVETGAGLGRLTTITACLLASAVVLSASAYNPFIYFQF